MINHRKLVSIVESHAGDAKKQGRNDYDSTHIGVKAMVSEVTESLGIERDGFGRPSIKAGSARPEEYDLVEVAEAIGEVFGFRNFARSLLDRREQLQFHGATALEAGPGIDPTVFGAINLFVSTTAGLVEAKVIEKFNDPLYIGDQLVETMPTRLNGQKLIGVTGIGDKAQSRSPGEPHPRAGFGQHYVQTPELEEKALAVEVTQEADFYDITGQVMMTAEGVGTELGYRKECTQADLVLGVTNPYVYNGTGYSTYQTTAPWINSHTNVMQDYSDLDNALDLLRAMTDPATGKEILVQARTILHMPERRTKFNTVLNAQEIRNTTNTNTVTIAPNPIKGVYPTVESQIWRNRVIGATGLNAGTTHGPEYWYIGDFKKAFKWMEAWPLRVNPVSANEFVMRDRGLIGAFFANYRGIGAVVEPRYVVRNISG